MTVPAAAASEIAARPPAASESIEKLFKERNDSLLRFLRARLHSASEAHEVAQEAYVQLLGLDNPNAISFLSAYLFRTAANLATNRMKQRSRRQELDEMIFIGGDEARSPEHSCAAQQDLDVVSRALESLPPKCARAFMLVKFEDLDFNQAGKAMGLHPRQVRRYVARALEHCHEALQASLETSGKTQGSRP